jgi:transcriptional regulator with XRE-family HTH domain
MKTRIKELREKLGYSQMFLATLTGLSLQTVARIENGDDKARQSTLEKIAKALGVTTAELYDTGED